MLIHLIFALAKLADNKTSGGAQVFHRSRPGEKVALLCPHCNAVGTTTEMFMEQRQGKRGSWLSEKTVLECDACKRFMDVGAFENDGNGILQVKTVECPFCQTPNPATCHVCRWCQKTVG
jgi:hypothetical protein